VADLLPRQGHLYVVDLEPRVGTRPGKQRPCLAIQPNEINEAGHPGTVVLPLTMKLAKGDAYPLRVRIPRGVCGLRTESEVLVDQILAWDNTLFRRELGPLPEDLQEKIRQALLECLDLV